MRTLGPSPLGLMVTLVVGVFGIARAEDVAQEVRSLFSNRCFACHGPDAEQREAGLRLDERRSFLAEAASGEIPVVPGQPESSELLRRITSDSEDERMPPPGFGEALAPSEIRMIRQWIAAGGQYSTHWSFVHPQRPALPVDLPVSPQHPWLENPIDRLVLARQFERGLYPSEPATKSDQLRRLSLDLTGLPPTAEQVRQFANDESPHAYERQVDRLLASPAYGEHWARKWLDLARYADSAGYADDPPRTIWAYRDWVIRALNKNLPVDEFTIQQIAGDMLEDPNSDQLVATAFHRNTLTNNEGGTNDEEFRNVAIVDRVNTTMAVWMGVTMACAQCHSHKYDPISQEEYFQLFAVFNQTKDADRRDESPTVELLSDHQENQKRQLVMRRLELEEKLSCWDEALESELADWNRNFKEPTWSSLIPTNFQSLRQSDVSFGEHGNILVSPTANNIVSDTYTIEFPLEPERMEFPIRAISVQTLPESSLPGEGAGLGGGNFVVTGIKATLEPRKSDRTRVRYVQVDLPGKSKILSIAEIQLLSEGNLLDLKEARATQSSTAYEGEARLAIDGNTRGDYHADQSTTHTDKSDDPWWKLDLTKEVPVDKIIIWNRTDNQLQSRLDGARVSLRTADGEKIFEQTLRSARDQHEFTIQEIRQIEFTAAYADYSQTGFEAAMVVDADPDTGWAVGGEITKRHRLTLIPREPISIDGPTMFKLQLEHNSAHRHHLLGSFRIETTGSGSVVDWATLGPSLRRIQSQAEGSRTSQDQGRLQRFFSRHIAVGTQPWRDEIEDIDKRLSSLKPETSVPIMREVEASGRRETHIQIRGNYKSLGQRVEPGTPAAFHQIDRGADPAPWNRLDLARWLVSHDNPLTARVWMNRMWESLFGLGIVRSSEEFGAQGDSPSHPELLDWLAVEFMESGWDQKAMLRRIVTSQVYRQTSQVTQAALSQDLENVWLSRGPRVRLSAEMVRDQALSTAGILSHRMYGPPVRPPQPDMGLKAAFGSATDWQTSDGEDRYRRGVYTTWRRSNPYPSMATFDAPSREVCTLRRDSTNTPLQALVTLNDPGFVEAAQALARSVVLYTPELQRDDLRLKEIFRLATSREPVDRELATLARLLADARNKLDRESARQLATDPLGPLPEEANVEELAAYTAVCNVVLNLDEVLMKR